MATGTTPQGPVPAQGAAQPAAGPPVPPPAEAATAKPLVRGTPMPEGMEAPPGSVRFEHVCCQAVRPNPEDSDFPVETRKEPYVTYESPLRPTAYFGAWVAAVGTAAGAAVLFSFLGVPVAMWVMVALAAAIALYLFASGLATGSALKHIEVEATRHVIEPKLERGRVFHMALDTQASRIPGGLQVTISDKPSPGLRPVEPPSVDGNGRIHYKVRPQARGLLTFAGLEVRVESKNRLWAQEREYRLRTTVEVNPSLAAVAMRAQLTGYVPFGLGAPKNLVKLYRDIEYEEVRPFGPGDRLKDVDWKRMAINNQMIIRRRTTELESTILFVFDMSHSMLTDQAGFRNIDLAVELATEMAQEGLRRNHECGLLAFNEQEILDHVRPTRKKTQFKRILQHLQFLADHHLAEDDEKPPEITITGNPENLRLGMSQGIKQRSTAKMTMIVFSDLQQTPEEIVQGIAKAAGTGQGVLVMYLPAPKLRPVGGAKRREPDEADEDQRGTQHTNRMRELLMGNGVDFLEANPHPQDLDLNVPLPPELAAELGIEQEEETAVPPAAGGAGAGKGKAPGAGAA